MFLTFVLATVVIVLISWFLSWFSLQKISRDLKNFPGPKPLPIIGSALDFPNSVEFLKTLQRYVKEYGSSFRLQLGPNRIIVVLADAGLIEKVLNSIKQIDKSPEYNVLHKWLGLGLLTSTGKRWHQHRKIITPTFHFEILEQFVDVFNKSVNVLAEKLKPEVGKESVDIYPYVTLSALDSICETAMGTAVNAQDDPDSLYVRSVKEMSRIVAVRSFSPFKQFDAFFAFSRDYYKMRSCLKILHGYSNAVIVKRRDALLKSTNGTASQQSGNSDEFGKKKRMAFLDLLLHATVDGESLTDSDIREEVDTFMFEGHDTTASAMAFALYLLANNKKQQDRAFEEIYDIFGSDLSKPATHRNFLDMNYLELVIKETLRIYPSVPIYARKLHEDCNHEGKCIPAGTTAVIFAFGMQKDEKLFPDPDVFNPERFLPENQTNRPFYSYLPFSAGPRNCIGQKFAMLEMKSTISTILRHYELFPATPEHKVILAAETILKSANGIRIQIQKRTYPKD